MPRRLFSRLVHRGKPVGDVNRRNLVQEEADKLKPLELPALVESRTGKRNPAEAVRLETGDVATILEVTKSPRIGEIDNTFREKIVHASEVVLGTRRRLGGGPSGSHGGFGLKRNGFPERPALQSESAWREHSTDAKTRADHKEVNVLRVQLFELVIPIGSTAATTDLPIDRVQVAFRLKRNRLRRGLGFPSRKPRFQGFQRIITPQLAKTTGIDHTDDKRESVGREERRAPKGPQTPSRTTAQPPDRERQSHQERL